MKVFTMLNSVYIIEVIHSSLLGTFPVDRNSEDFFDGLFVLVSLFL